MTTLRLFAEDCRLWDVVPWHQMRNAQPLTDEERANFKKHANVNIGKGDTVVRYDSRHIFLKNYDLAICIYDYQRDFR